MRSNIALIATISIRLIGEIVISLGKKEYSFYQK